MKIKILMLFVFVIKCANKKFFSTVTYNNKKLSSVLTRPQTKASKCLCLFTLKQTFAKHNQLKGTKIFVSRIIGRFVYDVMQTNTKETGIMSLRDL